MDQNITKRWPKNAHQLISAFFVSHYFGFLTNEVATVVTRQNSNLVVFFLVHIISRSTLEML